MKKMITIIIIVVILIAGLALLHFKQQKVIDTGTPLLLKTRVIDPRDPFMGDYIELNYEISSISSDAEGTVYVKLKMIDEVSEGSIYGYNGISLEKPEGLFIKGNKDGSRISYGIEKLYVPEGEGLDVEKAARNAELLVEVLINQKGDSLIKGYYINGDYYSVIEE